MAQEVRKAVCHFCYGRCRLLIHSENGRFLRAEEDPDCPLTNNIWPPVEACLKQRGIKEFVEHPDRLRFPLKRAGEKGEGKWQRISWSQAFDEVADKLQRLKDKHGGGTLFLTTGTGRTTSHFEGRFFHLFGSTNYGGQTRICHPPKYVTSTIMLGWPDREAAIYPPSGKPIEQAEDVTKCILLVGLEPSQAWGRLWAAITEAKPLGLKLIVIDPRKTPAAELADVWLQLRPQTDVAVLMSMVNVIIEEGLYDEEFVGKWCHGFDKLVERAQEYPPEKVAEISWVPAEKIREAARVYATNRPSVSRHGMGVEHQTQSIEAIQARYILAAITGNIDVPGGHYMTGLPKKENDIITEPELELAETLSPEQKRKQIGADIGPVLSLRGWDLWHPHVTRVYGKTPYIARSLATGHMPSILRAVLTGEPYPVRAAITVANNFMVSNANTKLIYKALKSLDLYLVCEYWMTPGAELADYVLPVTSWLERPYFLSSVVGGDILPYAGEQALPASIPGEFDRKTDYDIFRELGLRLGQVEYWPWENLEQTYDYQLSPRGITWKEFMANGGFQAAPVEYRKYEKWGFATPTGKVELYSTILEQLGHNPLPGYKESTENPVTRPDLAKEYPLYLITGGRFQPYFHSEQRQIDSIRSRRPYPTVQIHPDTAKGLGVGSGDWAWIETARGRIRMKCELFPGIDPRVVHCEHGWWFPELPGEEPWLHGIWESNVNVLTNDDPDACGEISGSWPLKVALCKVYRCKAY